MRAELKRLHSPDADDLASFVPANAEEFGILVQAMVGPEGEDSEEAFDILVCTPQWIGRCVESGPVIGRHHLIVGAYDFQSVAEFIRAYCRGCEGATWQDIGPKVGRLGKWEFEDYSE